MAFHKALKDLNLLDRFLFAEAMEDPVIMQTILEIILGKDILLKYPPQAEKEKLIELLRYIEHTTEKVIEQRRAREEGVAEGRAEGAEHKLFVQIYKKTVQRLQSFSHCRQSRGRNTGYTGHV